MITYRTLPCLVRPIHNEGKRWTKPPPPQVFQRVPRQFTPEPRPPAPDPRKILIALQYWHQDIPDLHDLARTLAAMQPPGSAVADFLVIARFDIPDAPEEAVTTLAEKFDVTWRRSKRIGVGHPHGCNMLWLGCLDYLGEVPGKYKAIFTMETDSCPLVPDWIDRMNRAWDQSGIRVLGIEVEDPRLNWHMNGNTIWSTDDYVVSAMKTHVESLSPTQPWDYYSPRIVERLGAKHMPGWIQIYTSERVHLSEERLSELVRQGTWLIHGVKDDSVRRYARQICVR